MHHLTARRGKSEIAARSGQRHAVAVSGAGSRSDAVARLAAEIVAAAVARIGSCVSGAPPRRLAGRGLAVGTRCAGNHWPSLVTCRNSARARNQLSRCSSVHGANEEAAACGCGRWLILRFGPAIVTRAYIRAPVVPPALVDALGRCERLIGPCLGALRPSAWKHAAATRSETPRAVGDRIGLCLMSGQGEVPDCLWFQGAKLRPHYDG